MYPGDPNAAGANVYNCRCTLISAINGHEIEGSEIYKNNHRDELEGVSWEEWKKEKQKYKASQSGSVKKQKPKSAANDGFVGKSNSDIIKPSEITSDRIIRKLTRRSRNKTGSMTADEYAEYKRELDSVKDLKQIWLAKDEYAMVMKEFNRYMSDKDRKHALVSRPIRNHVYTIINYGFNNYIVVRKVRIK